MPALYQVDDIKHGKESHRDVDISVGAGTIVVEPGSVAIVVGRALVIRSHDSDAVEGAPS